MIPEQHGVYVHVPWCASRCPYCAFNTYVDRQAPYERWTRGILDQWEMEQRHFPGPAHSLYFGGGTPSLAPLESLRPILAAIPRGPGAEVTLEANPGNLSEQRLEGWLSTGVNRISVGIQTFQPELSHLLNRGHTVHEARRLAAMVARAGLASWSLDLIFGLPGQRLEQLDADLDAIIDLAPPHVSLYGLTYEAGTPLRRALDGGQLRPIDEELWADMYARILERLEGAGLERYEVSNYARPGHRARHNEAVWRGGTYAGLGPGAHGYRPDGSRSLGLSALEDWLADLAGQTELPAPEEAATDLILSTLRHCSGLDLSVLEARTRHRIRPSVVEGLVQRGSLLQEGSWIRLPRHAYPVADGIVARLAAGLRPISA
jgi:oxygen-independent coproporphyrinogen III oxidase